MEFDSQRWIQSITEEPILILHAQDDNTIPYELGEKTFSPNVCSISLKFELFIFCHLEKSP